jgi:hypothetical protein
MSSRNQICALKILNMTGLLKSIRFAMETHADAGAPVAGAWLLLLRLWAGFQAVGGPRS